MQFIAQVRLLFFCLLVVRLQSEGNNLYALSPRLLSYMRAHVITERVEKHQALMQQECFLKRQAHARFASRRSRRATVAW